MTYAPRRILPVLLFVALIAQGCQSDSQKLYVAKQTYRAGELAVTPLIEKDLLTPDTVEKIVAARNFAKAAIADADKAFQAGGGLGFGFAMQEVGARLDDFMRLVGQFKNTNGNK